jgi:hypothetical protein
MIRPPMIPASLAAIVTFAGLALVYWSLTELGLLRSTAAESANAATVPSGTGASSSGTTVGLGGEKIIGHLGARDSGASGRGMVAL